MTPADPTEPPGDPVPVAPDAVLELRAAVLRGGASPAAARLPGDDHPDALHLAVVEGDRPVAVGSLLPEPHPDGPGVAAWRVRGMATEPGRRGRGLGRRVLDGLLERAGPAPVWCQARLGAVAFYERAGFVADGPVTDLDGLGPHRRLVRPARR